MFLKFLRGIVVDLPSPSRLRYIWNIGSILGVFLGFQIVRGLFLAFQFSGDIELSFDRVVHLMRDVNIGWLLRVFHANGARFFFIFLYIHIGRGIYYSSYRVIHVWTRGVTIFLLRMGTAFLGYVLPWGQISFWAATVITNLLSAIPYIGGGVVEWIWGGFSVGNPTLIRFFAFHFLMPFVILSIVGFHLVYLHESGSSNPLGLMKSADKIRFSPYFIVKDIFGLLFVLLLFILICGGFPFIFMDVENFIPSNPIITPVHIQPEWYFLFAYAILRSIPRKVGGVLALLCSVSILFVFPLIIKVRYRRGGFYFIFKLFFWIIVGNWFVLTWIGACEVDTPYRSLGEVGRFLYFQFFFFISLSYFIQDVCLYINLVYLSMIKINYGPFVLIIKLLKIETDLAYADLNSNHVIF